MNNGNILNSLLNATGANPAAGQNITPKSRAETGEQFRNVLERARPEIAAFNAEPRKAQTNVNRKAESRQSTEVSDTRKNSGADIRKQEKSAVKKAADEKEKPEMRGTEGSTAKVPSNDTSSKSENGVDASKNETMDGKAADVSGIDAVDEIANPLRTLTDESLLLGKTGDEAEEGDAVLNTAETEGISADAVALGSLLVSPLKAPVDDTPASITLDLSEAPETETPLMEELESASPLASLTPNSIQNNLRTDSGTAPGSSVANPVGVAINQLGQESVVTEEQASATSDISQEADAVENPDLFLLSGKATFSKLMDSAATPDKSIPLVDPAKPALTSTVLAEPAVRLAESTSPAARGFLVQTGIPVTVGQPQWSQAVGEKVLWLAAQNVSAAEIRLDPPDLGTMHVKVSLNQDQASVTFSSPHPAVREALDQQLNRLREMFSEQGLNLVNVDVSDRSFAQHQQGREQSENANSANEELNDEDLLPIGITTIASTRLVDHYA